MKFIKGSNHAFCTALFLSFCFWDSHIYSCAKKEEIYIVLQNPLKVTGVSSRVDGCETESLHAKAGAVILLSSGLYQPSVTPVPYGHAPLNTPCLWLLTHRMPRDVCKHGACGRRNDSTGSVLVTWSLLVASVLSCPLASHTPLLQGAWFEWTHLKPSSLSFIVVINQRCRQTHWNQTAKPAPLSRFGFRYMMHVGCSILLFF